MKFIILVVLFAVAAADSYKAVEYAPKYEAPKYVAPKNESPKYESPKYETPKYEAPKYESPKYETPKYKEVAYAPQPYSFGYDVQDKESYTDFDHSEKADGKVTTGSYRVALPDGRTQIVTYKADSYGYTASPLPSRTGLKWKNLKQGRNLSKNYNK